MTTFKRCCAVFVFACCITTINAAQRYEENDEGFFKKIATLFEDGGAAAVKMFIDRDMNEWKSVNINIAVIGQSGSGKSSFTNAILGLTADDEGGADVGVIETTRTVKSYPHPQNSKIILWDLPGVGTPTFLRDEYFYKVNVNQFDYFILLTSDRFREDDLWLANELKNKEKLFYFIRSKIGQDVENNLKSHPKSHNKTAVLYTIRRNCEEHLKQAGFEREIFLIDSYDTDKYDFDAFSAKLVEDAPVMKREAMVLSMAVQTESMISAKEQALSDRIHKLALLSGIAGAIPVILFDTAVDIAIIIEEASFYRKQFGLDEEVLQEYAAQVRMPLDELKTFLGLQSTLIKLSSEELFKYFTKKGAKKAATLTTTKYMKYLLPLLGSAISATSSYVMTSWCLHDLLDVMAEDARKIIRHRRDFRN